MKILQLFRVPIQAEFVNRYLQYMGLSGMDDDTEFTREQLDLLNAGETLLELMGDEISEVYLPCKRRLYVDLLPKSTAIVVILRQLLRACDAPVRLHTRIGQRKGKKCTIYWLKPVELGDKEYVMKYNPAPVVFSLRGGVMSPRDVPTGSF